MGLLRHKTSPFMQNHAETGLKPLTLRHSEEDVIAFVNRLHNCSQALVVRQWSRYLP